MQKKNEENTKKTGYKWAIPLETVLWFWQEEKAVKRNVWTIRTTLFNRFPISLHLLKGIRTKKG